MKKILLIGILLLCFKNITYAQTAPQNSINTTIPNLSPQTPTTANLGKYGEVQVNESTGTISPSISLFDFYTGISNLPISLQYSGNAVRVTQDPTWVGINWNLNAGGVITRVVRDLPDEKHRPYGNSPSYFKSESELNLINGANDYDPLVNPWSDYLKTLANDHASNNSVDSEVDLFNFNFMGYSGSFFLDDNNVGHLVKYDKEMTINFYYDGGSNKSTIVIKTFEGNIYSFGGPEASESSRSYVSAGAGSSNEANNPFIQNAFYLTQVNYLLGGYLSFEYEHQIGYLDQQHNTIIGKQESLRVPKTAPSSCTVNPKKNIIKVIESCISLKYIRSSFTDQFVEFDSEMLKPLSGEGIVQLHNIYLKTTNQSSTTDFLKKIELEYLALTVDHWDTIISQNQFRNEKFFLTKVKFFDSANIFQNNYEMTYNYPDILPRSSYFLYAIPEDLFLTEKLGYYYAQDELGYYNGETTNKTTLPRTSYELANTLCPILANRRANWYYSQAGSLQKIKYPTGGESTFNYELPIKGYEPVYNPTGTQMIVTYNYFHDNRDSPHTSNGSTNNYGHPEGMIPYGADVTRTVTNSSNSSIITVTTPVKVPVVFMTNVVGNSYSHLITLKFEAINLLTNQVTQINSTINQNQLINLGGNSIEFIDNDINHFFYLDVGTYKFKYIVEINQADSHNSNNAIHIGNSVYSKVVFHLPSSFQEVFNPGLRIKEIITSNILMPNVPAEKTVYKYKSLYDLANDPNKEYYQFNPSFSYDTREKDPVDTFAPYYDVLNLTANTVNNVFHNESGTYNYPYVTVSYGGSNFENGGKELSFYESSGQPVTQYGFTYYTIPYWTADVEMFQHDFNCGSFINSGDNGTFLNSVLHEETLFDKDLNILKKTNYDYSYETNGFEMNNVKPNLFCSDITNKFVYYLYKTKSYKFKQTVTTTKDVVNLNIPHSEVTTLVTKDYDPDKVSLPKSITTTTSQGISKQTKLYYPSDIAAIGNVTGNDATLLTQMQNNHNVAEVVKMESYANGFLLDTKQVFYKNFGSKILPHIIQSKKGVASDPNVLEDRVVIEGYNSVGKPTIVKLANGTYTEYVYNDKQQVVLKIENAQYLGENEARIKPIEVIIDNPCKYQNELPKSMVTTYNYDQVTNNLTSIVDPKCDIIYYEYDDFNRLKLVRDRNGKILSENEYHYKP